MSSVACRFCSRQNPPESQFCNACGSPLNLKPCPECEAVNNRDVQLCYQCGAAFALDSEVVVATGGDDFTLNETPVATAERVRTPELFAQSLQTLAELEREILRAPAPRSDVPLALPAVAEPSAAFHRRTAGSRWHQIAVALALVVAIEALAYFAHRPHTAIDEWLAGIQLGVLALARANASGERTMPASADPAETTPAVAVTSNEASNQTGTETESTLDVQAPVPRDDASNDVSAAAPTMAEQDPVAASPTDGPEQSDVGDAALLAQSEESANRAQPDEPVNRSQSDESPNRAESDEPLKRAQSDESANRAQSDEPLKRAQPNAPRKRAPSAVANAKRRPPAERFQEPQRPPGLPATAPSSADRPCTQAVAALGLC